MDKKLAQAILVQYCSDCHATDFYSDPSSETSYQKLIRLIKVKPCYKINGVPTININDKIMRPFNIFDGIHLRAFMLEAWKDEVRGMNKFRMRSVQEQRCIEAKEWLNEFLLDMNKQYISDEDIEAADTEEKRVELFKDFDEDDLMFRVSDGRGTLVIEGWNDHFKNTSERAKVQNKMKSQLAHIREYEEGVDNREAFAAYRPCRVKHYIKFGNKNLKDAEI